METRVIQKKDSIGMIQDRIKWAAGAERKGLTLKHTEEMELIDSSPCDVS